MTSFLTEHYGGPFVSGVADNYNIVLRCVGEIFHVHVPYCCGNFVSFFVVC